MSNQLNTLVNSVATACGARKELPGGKSENTNDVDIIVYSVDRHPGVEVPPVLPGLRTLRMVVASGVGVADEGPEKARAK
jgi:hypothetical protein